VYAVGTAAWAWLLRRVFLETAEVDLVFVSSRGAFVRDEVVVGQDGDGQAFQLDGLAVLVGAVELDTADGGDDVDPPGCDADLKDDPRLDEVVLADRLQWGAKRGQCTIDLSGILRGGLDPNIDISRGARITMSAHGIGPNEEEPNSVVAQDAQHVSVVVVQRSLVPGVTRFRRLVPT